MFILFEWLTSNCPLEQSGDVDVEFIRLQLYSDLASHGCVAHMCNLTHEREPHGSTDFLFKFCISVPFGFAPSGWAGTNATASFAFIQTIFLPQSLLS